MHAKNLRTIVRRFFERHGRHDGTQSALPGYARCYKGNDSRNLSQNQEQADGDQQFLVRLLPEQEKQQKQQQQIARIQILQMQ